MHQSSKPSQVGLRKISVPKAENYVGLDSTTTSELLNYVATGPASVFPDNCVAGVSTKHLCECAHCLLQRGVTPTAETERRAAARATREFADFCALVREIVEPKGKWICR